MGGGIGERITARCLDRFFVWSLGRWGRLDFFLKGQFFCLVLRALVVVGGGVGGVGLTTVFTKLMSIFAFDSYLGSNSDNPGCSLCRVIAIRSNDVFNKPILGKST